MPSSFHETRFPLHIAFGATSSPERRTDIVTLGSGHEERNARWASSRRRYNAGQGVRTMNDLHDVLSFFEERRGRLYGFRWPDRTDYKSCPPLNTISPLDQVIGSGNGSETTFQLTKTYGSSFDPYKRIITKPVNGTERIAINGNETSAYTFDTTKGLINFTTPPTSGAVITAGYEFDVPVRFDEDRIDINLSQFKAGEIPSIAMLEILL